MVSSFEPALLATFSSFLVHASITKPLAAGVRVRRLRVLRKPDGFPVVPVTPPAAVDRLREQGPAFLPFLVSAAVWEVTCVPAPSPSPATPPRDASPQTDPLAPRSSGKMLTIVTDGSLPSWGLASCQASCPSWTLTNLPPV
mmetsp:Transcript_8805/g.25375  ORF Transcript_8805/g.25375 Transcript_8805/m.25375 type:complete len:142 (+) Transcript_8805:273-698(+)